MKDDTKTKMVRGFTVKVDTYFYDVLVHKTFRLRGEPFEVVISAFTGSFNSKEEAMAIYNDTNSIEAIREFVSLYADTVKWFIDEKK